MKTRSLRALACLLLMSFEIFAQNDRCHIIISGKVLDAHDASPLTFAEVFIRELQRGAVVDSTGHYKISGICPGRYTFVTTHIGCEPVEKVITIRKSMDDLNFYPEHHQELLQEAEIVVKQTRQSAEARSNLSTTELEASQGKPLGEALEKVSGVNSLKSGSSIVKPAIHGLYGNRIITLNHGIRQEDQQWGLEHGLNIDLFSADAVSVIKGVGAVEYGAGAAGGVVQVSSAPLPYGDSLSGEAYLIGQSNGRGGTTALKLSRGLGENMAGQLSLSGQKLGDRQAPDYHLTNTGTEGLNGSFRLGYRSDRLQLELYYSRYTRRLAILRSSHLGSTTDYEEAIARSEPFYIEPFSYKIESPRQWLSHDLAKLSAKYIVNEDHFLETKYGFQYDQRKEFDRGRGDRNTIPANYLRLATQTLDATLSSQYSEKWSGKYGLSGMLQVNSNDPETGIRPILPNYNLYRAGAFITQKVKINRWVLEAGSRYDYEYNFVQKFDHRNNLLQLPFHFHNLAASAGGTFSLNENWQFSSLMAGAYRSPHVNELLSEGLHHGAATIEEGNIDLKPERSLNWSNTLVFHPSTKLRAELTAYVNPFLDYIYLRPLSERRLTVRGSFPVYQYTQNNVLLGGLDLSADLILPGGLQYHFRGNYVRGYNLDAREDLVLIAPPQASHALRFELNPAKGKLRTVFAELEHKLVSRQNHYPEGQDLSDPPAGYQLLHLSVGMTRPFKNNTALSLSAAAENLLNTSYRDYLNRFRYYADQAGSNFIVKIKYQF